MMSFLRANAGGIASGCLIVGLLLIFAGGGYWLVIRDFDLTARLLVAAGILGIAGWVGLRPDTPAAARASSRRATVQGANATIMSIAVIAILGFVNYFGNQLPQRLDLTANAQNTLAPETLRVIDALKQPVRVTGFFQGEDIQRRQTLQDLMRSYTSRQNLIQFDFVDPDQNPAAAQAAGIRILGTTLFESGGRRETITGTSESDITTALLKLSTNRTPRVGLLSGHGEKSVESSDREGWSGVRPLLQSQNATIETISFSQVVTPAAQLATELDLLIIGGPRTEFSPEDLAATNAFIDAGGRLIVMVDPIAQPLQSTQMILQRYALQQQPNWVIDPANALRQDPAAFIAQRYEATPVTDPLQGLPSVFTGVCSLAPVPGQTPGGRQQAMIQSSNRAWLDADAREPNAEGKAAAIQTLAYLYTPPDADNPAAATAPRGRAALLCDSDFATNQWVNQPNAVNRDLVGNLVNWAAGSDDLITIRPKPFQSRNMVLTTQQQNFLFFSSSLFLPLIVLFLGGLMWWRRR